MRYRQLLAVAAVLLFFSGVDLYLLLIDYTIVTPKDWVTLFGVLSAPLAIAGLYRKHLFERPMLRIALWSCAYLTISIAGFSRSDAAVQELWNRLLTVSFLALIGFVLSTPESRTAAGIAAIVVVVATVVINGIEVVRPEWFLMGVSRRSSGLYMNANSCGAALVLGMIIGAPLLPRWLRPPFYLIVGAAVALTFSRSAIVGWMIASSLLVAFDATRTRARELVIGGVAAAALLLFVVQGAVATGFIEGLASDDNLSNRVSFFKTLDAPDFAAQERRAVAVKAWGMFADHPWRGNGLASTLEWNEWIATHNMFLFFMAEHGLVGALILPALLICVLLSRPVGAGGPPWAFCAFTLWFAFFSHSLLAERYHLFAFAFFVMGGTIESRAAEREVVGAFPARISAASDPLTSAVGGR